MLIYIHIYIGRNVDMNTVNLPISIKEQFYTSFTEAAAK